MLFLEGVRFLQIRGCATRRRRCAERRNFQGGFRGGFLVPAVGVSQKAPRSVRLSASSFFVISVLVGSDHVF